MPVPFGSAFWPASVQPKKIGPLANPLFEVRQSPLSFRSPRAFPHERSLVLQHRPDVAYDMVMAVGLGDKAASRRQLRVLRFGATGGDQERDPRPVQGGMVGQGETVH